MKNIILLILAFVLAIVLTLAALYLFWFIFHDFEWGNGFWEVLLSLISVIILLTCHITFLVVVICGAAWHGVFCMWKKVFEEENTNKSIQYTNHNHYNILDDYSDMHGSNEDKSYLYDDYAYLCDDGDDYV